MDSKDKMINDLKSIVQPYIQNEEAFEKLNEDTNFINDSKINFVNLVDVILDIEDKFDIDIDNESMDKMLNVRSMKESAYKVFIQAGGNRFFNPSTIECSLDSLCNGYVIIDQATYCTTTSINKDYIFSMATLNNTVANTSIFQLPDKNAKIKSDFIYQQVINDFATMDGLNVEDLKIRKRESGVPIIIHHNKPLNIALFISHHGDYGAYSTLKLNQRT